MNTESSYYCQHLLEANNTDILDTFYVRHSSGKGLENYIRFYAINEERNNLSRTYLIKDSETHEIAGYFSIKAGMIRINETISSKELEFDSLPAIELSNFAVNDSYRIAHSGETKSQFLGYLIFQRFILPTIQEISDKLGVAVLYIFALPEKKLIEHYKTYGFQRLSKDKETAMHQWIRPRYDKDCIFMWQLL